MDTRKIRKLIELVKETGIGELEVKSGEDSVRITQPGQHITMPIAPMMQQAPLAVGAPAPSATPNPTTQTTEKNNTSTDGHTVLSPMVGTIYLAPTPGASPFVSVGQHINAGETLCLIEAMKMFNKIEADKSGVISARLIDNEQPVEYDQPLFIIETE